MPNFLEGKSDYIIVAEEINVGTQVLFEIKKHTRYFFFNICIY